MQKLQMKTVERIRKYKLNNYKLHMTRKYKLIANCLKIHQEKLKKKIHLLYKKLQKEAINSTESKLYKEKEEVSEEYCETTDHFYHRLLRFL